MRRRLYFMLPDVSSARAMLDELVAVGIEQRYMHFCAREGLLAADMPEANSLQKTDLIHGAEVGMLIGGISGLLAGGLWLIFPPESMEMRIVALLVSAIGGALFGSWMSANAARSIPSSRLQPFLLDIDAGKVLLMVDVPFRQISDIQQMVSKQHPEIHFGGVDPHVPVFI
ncbi:DUF1269 domain-containing protein [Undibacterium sp. TS12]|uniref:DUF1269 domain-containing protein n=1 Tax=Undibacterium sp. TS12 TaxID=2908202 RepID=UPI001F4CAA41|nr:DUF1269 domain-containing protein [Undibacterium sp. TS12]MCH8621854.1 DUF1269 domain-containing protein [Undibacterium sp. TS12]